MIVRREPKGDTKEAVKLSKFFSNKDNTVFPIQSDLQRRYSWPSMHIDKFFKDYIINLFEENKEADESGEDCLYAKIGDAILTRVEDGYGFNGKCKKQEIIDMSQRITTVMSFIVVMLYIHLRNTNVECPSERAEMFEKYLKTKNGLSWKVVSTFRDSDFEEVIEECIDGSFKVDSKTIKSLTKCFNESNLKKNEVRYKSFRQVCAYVYSLVETTIGVNDDTILERLDLFLDKTYIQIEECDKEERVQKFIEVNTYRLGVPRKDIYKTLLCKTGENVDSKFQDFEEKLKLITKPKRINILKGDITVPEYIMRMALIVMDDTRETCKFSFSLADENNGLEYQINNGFLNTEEKILKYLDLCIEICNFLLNSMEYKQDERNEDWYLFTEGHISKHIWLYNILPCYAISIIKDEAKKEFSFEMLLKSFTAYSIKYFTSKSVQYIQTYMYSFAKEILTKGCDDYCFDDFKSSLEHVYNRTFGDFIDREVTKAVKRLDYTQSSCKTGIYAVLSCIEYLAQKHCGIKRDNLYRLTNKNEIEIDHIFPQSKENEKNESFIDSIGNLTFLEKPLNASKQDNETLTSDIYTDSSFISTKLMVDGNRYESLTNSQIDFIKENIIPFHADRSVINNFEARISDRANEIAYKIKNFLVQK